MKFFKITLLLTIYIKLLPSLNSQCLPYSGTILPKADTTKAAGFGVSMVVNDDVLVIASSDHDSLEYYAGLVHVYYKDANSQWIKSATLFPSDVQAYMGFGTRIAMTQNTIVIGLENGYHEGEKTFAKLYVFEKSPNDTWTTTSESYQITIPDRSFFSGFDISESYLAAGYTYRLNFGPLEYHVNIYKKNNGIFELESQLELPYADSDVQTNFGENMSITNDLLAIADPTYLYDDDKIGVTLIYERTGGIWNLEPSAYLTPSSYGPPFQNGFSSNIAVSGNTVFVGNIKYPVSESENTIAVFVYEKPATGWADMTENAQLVVSKESGSLFHSFRDLRLKPFNDYLLLSNASRTKDVFIFKKNGNSWTDQSELNVLSSSEIDDSRNFGISLAINSEYLFVGATDNLTGKIEQVYQYNHSESNLEGIESPSRIIDDITISAGGDRFAKDMSIYQNTLVIGANSDNNLGNFTGAAYTYEFDGLAWNNTSIIRSPLVKAEDNFGFAVEISKNYLFISATRADSINEDSTVKWHNIGRVYVYEKQDNDWTYHSTLLSPIVKKEGKFGGELKINNDELLISEYNTNSSGETGLVHIFNLNDDKKWEYKATLRPLVRNFFFGNSLALNDSIIVVGAGGTFQNTPGAYVYKKNGEWNDMTESATLTTGERHNFDRFGFDVDLYGDNIIVGAPSYNQGEDGKRFGRVYVYEKPTNGWVSEINNIAYLEPLERLHENLFGFSIMIDDHSIKVGAPHSTLYSNTAGSENDINEPKPGHAYVFYNNGTDWQTATENKILESPNPEPLDGFGFSIASFNGHFFVGSYLDDTEVGEQSGAVHTYFDLPYIITADTTICAETDSIELIGFPTGGTFTGNGVVGNYFKPLAAGSGTHTIQYQIEDCVNKPVLKIEIIEQLTEIEILNDSIYICQGEDSVIISYNYSSLNTAVNWSYSDDKISYSDLITTTQSPFYAKNIGRYKVSVSNQCYTYEDIVDIKTESINVQEDFEICSDEIEIQLSNYTPSDGIWSGNSIDDDANVDLLILDTGNHLYQYQVERENCVYKDSLTINVHRIPEFTFEPNDKSYIVCQSDELEIFASNLDDNWNSQWEYSGDSLDFSPISSISSRILSPSQKGYYKLYTTDGYCEKESKSIKVDYYTDGSIEMPNVFTPNNDGINDTFRFNHEDITLERLIIVDRRGLVVFQSHDLSNEWTGTNQPSGIYYYSLNYFNNCDPTVSLHLKGVLSLLK